MNTKTKWKITGNIFLAIGSASIGAIYGTTELDTLIDRTFQLIVSIVIIGVAVVFLNKGE